jgi:hypothetical protein
MILLGIVPIVIANVVCPSSPPYPPCCISNEWFSGGWIYLVFVGISTILLFFSLVYMVSKIIPKPEWVIWIKDEFYQTIISVVIVVMLVAVLSAVCGVFTSIAGDDPFSIAHDYLNGLVWDKTINYATRAFQDSLICQLVAGYKTHMGPTSLGTTYSQHIGLRTVAVNFDFLYTLFAGLSASLMIQDIGLSIIQAFAFRIMLPIGVLFRVFPFLRRAGAMFIALAIGLYIVYPLCFVMNKMIVDSVMGDIEPALVSSANQIQNIAEPFILMIISPFLPWALTDLFWLMQQAALLLPQAIFLPTLNLVITLTFIKNAARVLSQNFGGE